MLKQNFHLDKWYLDTISPTGDAVIFYIAHLKWRGFNLYYYNRLSYTAEKGVENKVALKRVPAPEWNGNILQWNNAPETAIWEALTPPVRETLLQSEAGDIEWDCVMPHGRTTLKQGNKNSTGFGYAERLNMTLPPWKFAIDELYWGRFLAENHNITWIEWRGPIPRFLLFHNGKRYNSGSVSETEVTFDKFRLTFSDEQILRKGSLWTTVFSRFPWLRLLFPFKILLTNECKWRSKGTLYTSNTELATGWAIYEKVIWK